jgi:formylglycine-generating enzyme required for sulfatase activity
MPGAGPLPAPAMAGSPPLVVPAPRTPPDRTVPPLRELVDVPAGPYRLGEPGEEREVELAAVRIGRFPVVCAHMARFAAETGHPLSARLRARLADPQLEDHPATEVTFADALAFCAWAGARLPTGDEWEAAARGADARPWPWGETFEPERCACAEAAGGWSAPVRAHPDGASPCGAEQLAGNVWEWVADAPDPDGWRAVRGGSWLDYAWGVRASRVLPADPDRATATTGFRIALDP